MFVCFACGRVFDDEITMRDHVNEIHLSNKVFLFSLQVVNTVHKRIGKIRNNNLLLIKNLETGRLKKNFYFRIIYSNVVIVTNVLN